MKRFGLAAALAMGLSGLGSSGAAFAQGARAPDAATGNKGVAPVGRPLEQTSITHSAPPAGTTQTTGATDQNGTVKQMNAQEKAKVEAGGK